MGRVSKHVTDARRTRLQKLLVDRTYLPLAEVCAEFGVSEATARRDLASLESQQLIRRTHGGALGPYAGALGDFEAHFPTFEQRRATAQPAKAAIAQAVCELISPGMVVFIDSGSTCFAVAEALGAGPGGLTIVTHNLAAALRLGRVSSDIDIDVQLIGGTLLPRQAGVFGDDACRSLAGRRIDLAILGCEGIDQAGASNSQKDVVRLQRTVMKAATRRVLAVDASKLGVRAPVILAPWTLVDVLVTDASLQQLTDANVKLTPDQIKTVQVRGSPRTPNVDRSKEAQALRRSR